MARIHILGNSLSRSRCLSCHHKISFGEHYTIEATHPVAKMGLKDMVTYRHRHYPNCTAPLTGFGDDGMGKSYMEGS